MRRRVQNEFKVFGNIVMVFPLNSGKVFLVDAYSWNLLPKFGWKIGRNGYVECSKGKLHRLVAKLNGMLDDNKEHPIIDHKNKNILDNRAENLRPCNSMENAWNTTKPHGHQLKNGKWKFTFRKSFKTYDEAEDELRNGRFKFLSENRTCYNEETFDTYEEGWQWWKFQAGMHYGEFSPFANPYMECGEIVMRNKLI